MTSVIMQFGTSRFLQAHADLFLHEARESGQSVPNVVVVQTSGASERANRLSALADPAGYPVIVRGLEGEKPVERTTQVKGISKGLSSSSDWEEIVRLFSNDVSYVISNTGDSGFDISAEEPDADLSPDSPRPSFPGKLSQLLHARFLSGRRPVTLFPCELVNRNGPVLKAIVAEVAERSHAGRDFMAWLDEDVVFANSLVDRIVSEPIEPAGAVAEPYALWAIERMPGLKLPCAHPAIVLTDNLEPFERLKLHVLNLGHTVLADIWLRETRAKTETVREMLGDDNVRRRLDAVYRDEVVPGFKVHGMEE